MTPLNFVASMILLAAPTIAYAEGPWRELPKLPDAEGFAGLYAGVANDRLIVAGGANFPGKKPWDGGAKSWYDNVFALDRPEGAWKKIGVLPSSRGYGVSVSHKDAVYLVGGADGDRHYDAVLRIVTRGDGLEFTSLPPLPARRGFASGALVGSTIYVVGGQETPGGDSKGTVFAFDINDPKTPWKTLPDLPGPSRILATAAVYDGSLWIIGGAEVVKGERKYLKDAYRLDPARGWTRLTDLPTPSVAAPSPAPVGKDGPILLGGDAGDQLSTTPEKHRGFSRRMLQYHKDGWVDVGEIPAPRVTTPALAWRSLWIVPSGEVRPGVRSPAVWGLSHP